MRDWVAACNGAGIPCSEKFKLETVLGNPVKVGWGMELVLGTRAALWSG